jgi:hypothetical protein
MSDSDEMDRLYRDDEEKSVDQEEAATKSAVISNKILDPQSKGLKEGEEIVLRVVKNFGDESEVEYAPAKGGGKESGEEDAGESEEESDSTEKDLAALNQEGAY